MEPKGPLDALEANGVGSAGDEASPGSPGGAASRDQWRDGLAVYIATLGIAVFVQSGPAASVLGSHAGVIFAALWLYVPILILHWRSEDWRNFGLTLDQAPGSVPLFLGLCLLLVPYTAILAGWVVWVEVRPFAPAMPPGALELLLRQLLLVALPEEVFFRGYLQSRLDSLGPPHRLGRFTLGRGILPAAALFALAHLVLRADLRTLAVFVPGLLFGLLRERSGSVLLPILYHAICNLYRAVMLGGA